MKKDFDQIELNELKNMMVEDISNKHSYDIKNFMTEDEFKQVFKLRCIEGNPEEVKSWIEENKQIQFDLTQGLLFCCVNGNFPNVKYFLETPEVRKNINLYVPYEMGPPHHVSDGVLLHSHFNGHSDIVDYLLYNVNFDVCRDTLNYLKFHQTNDLLNKIEKRDLFFKLEKEMETSEIVKVSKVKL